MTTRIVETDAEKAARARARAAYETIRKARRALYVAHTDCYAPVPIPTPGGDYWEATKSDDLADLPNSTLLYTPDDLYVKHWNWWRNAYERITHEEMWEHILGAYADGPLDGDFLLTPRSFAEPSACGSEADTERN